MPDEHDLQSWSSFSVGYRSILDAMLPSQRSVMLKALSERAPGFQGFMRRDIRDRALRDLSRLSPAAAISGRAAWIERELNTYAADGWRRRDRDLGLADGASEIRRRCFDVLSANDGAPLAWRRILEIIK